MSANFFQRRVASALWIAAAVCVSALVAEGARAQGQSAAPSNQTIGRIDLGATKESVRVAGAVTLGGNGTLLGNGSTVTAGNTTLPIQLTRGGELDLCAHTELHLSQEDAPADPNSPLMLALDHGALQAHYSVGKNSDVILTPDLRILLSGPGKADVRIRVNRQGDTCVDNRGKNAPYVTVSEQIGAGVYRVKPDQRVMFQHGSVQEVVDNELEPCGCPAPPPPTEAVAGVTPHAKESTDKPSTSSSAAASHPVGGPSSTPADTAFPLAESEGLVPPPKLPSISKNVPLQTQSQVTTTLSYIAPREAVPTGAPDGRATPESAATAATAPAPGFGPNVNTGSEGVAEAPAKSQKRGFFGKIGHFLARVFG
jgi:hypothetical protein